MIKLMDLYNEIKVNRPLEKIPKGWTNESNSYKNTPEAIEAYGGEIIRSYFAPMEGWDPNHRDVVKIIKRDNKFIVNVLFAFGDDTDKGPFNSLKEAILFSINKMEEIKQEWVNNG